MCVCIYFFFFFRLFSIIHSFNFIEHFLQPFYIKKIPVDSLLKYCSLPTHDLLFNVYHITPSNRQNKQKEKKKFSLTIFPVWNLFFFPLPRRICNRNCIIPIDSNSEKCILLQSQNLIKNYYMSVSCFSWRWFAIKDYLLQLASKHELLDVLNLGESHRIILKWIVARYINDRFQHHHKSFYSTTARTDCTSCHSYHIH